MLLQEFTNCRKVLHLGLDEAASIAFGRQGGLDQGSEYWPRFFIDRDKMSVVMSGEIQAMTVTGARGRFHKDKLPAQSASRDL